jgi:hypothetical protein
MRISYSLMCLAMASCLTSACDRDEPARPGADSLEPGSAEPPPGAATNTAKERALDALASARCERELRCENIGAQKSYGSMDSCRAEVRSEWQKGFDAETCTGGIVEEKLNGCLAQLRDEKCDHPIATLGRMGACQPGAMCND